MFSNVKRLILSLSFLFIFAAAFYFITALYPDLLWFDSFNMGALWWFMISAKVKVFSLFFAVSFTWLIINYLIARRVSEKVSAEPRSDFHTPFAALNQLLAEISARTANRAQPQLPSKILNLAMIMGVIFLSMVLSLGALSWWEKIYLFINQSTFNLVDPILNKDVGFYVFSLPFFQDLHSWLTTLSFFTLVLVGWMYFSKNILLLIFTKNSQKSALKPHLFFLLAIIFILFAGKSWFNIHQLLFSPTGVVYGAGYTDINAGLFYEKSMMVLFGIQALILLLSSVSSSVRLPILFLGFIMAYSMVVGKIYPSILQRYVVSPNELEKEAPYIQHNIKFTRLAYGLEKIVEEKFPAAANLTKASIQDNEITIQNLRLWNREPLQQTFSQLQEIRLYYRFMNVDVDRYTIDGRLQQVMLSPRELDANELSSEAQTWINRHLIYTHGYGLCMTPVNEITPEGLPEFYIKDLPPVSNVDIFVNEPGIYFGEKTSEYVIVNTSEKEFDYPKGDKNVYTSYKGSGGIVLDSFIKRLIFAFKFSDFSILFNTNISLESRVMYDREIKSLAKKIAPFLTFDQDPYIVINDAGKLLWMLDAYTMTNKFPYSKPFGRSVNYLRNSVKITIDAYNGDIHFYIADPSDPIIQSISKVYPMVFEPFSQMPADLQAHIRYPKDLFKVQTLMYQTYHMTDTKVFYNKEDVWAIPSETYDGAQQKMDAYYIVTKIPGEEKESFVLMTPYTPTNKNNMIAWMSAKCDLDNYGQLKVFKFPKDKTILGPVQIESRIDQDTEISQKLTLWGQSGSRVIRGNLMVVPIEDSLIYVEPIYLQATQSTFPELKRVIFSYDDKVVMKPNLNEAISTVFGEGSYRSRQERESSPETSGQGIRKTGQLLIDSLVDEFQKFKAAAKKQDWLNFGKGLDKVDQLIKELKTSDK